MTLSRKQWDALEADLLRAGFTMADLGERVSWRGVIMFARHAGPGQSLYHVTNGPDSAWTLEAQIMALVVDVLNVANYQRGGGKGQRPKPLQRPGVRKDETQKFGGEAIDAASFDEMWGA